MKKEICVDALVQNWGTVYDFLEENLITMGVSKNCRTRVLIASEEIYVNISKYAYAENAGKVVIRFACNSEISMLEISFIDSGIAFDPTKKELPDIKASVSERKIGGLGIFMVHKMMDSLKYVYQEGKNNLTIFKKIN